MHNGIWFGACTWALLILFGLVPFPAHSNGGGLVVNAKATPDTPSIFDSGLKSTVIGRSEEGKNRRKKRSTPISIPIHKRSSLTRAKRADGHGLGAAEIARAVLERDAWRMRNFMGPTFKGINDREAQDGTGNGKDKRAGWETLPLSSYHGDALYYASVQFGTPPQTSKHHCWLASFLLTLLLDRFSRHVIGHGINRSLGRIVDV